MALVGSACSGLILFGSPAIANDWNPGRFSQLMGDPQEFARGTTKLTTQFFEGYTQSLIGILAAGALMSLVFK